MFAYNTTCHKSTKYTPFELMFNRTATLPIDINMEKKSPTELAVLPLQFDEVTHQQQQQKRNINYDVKRGNPHLFAVRKHVLVKDFHRKKCKGGKGTVGLTRSPKLWARVSIILKM